MNRYEIFRSLKHLEENVSQHELIGIAYGETIDDAADEIDECIKADLIADEDNIYAEYNVDVKPFDPAVLELEQYEYAASGILYPADSNAPENIIHEYGIKELKCENQNRIGIESGDIHLECLFFYLMCKIQSILSLMNDASIFIGQVKHLEFDLIRNQSH